MLALALASSVAPMPLKDLYAGNDSTLTFCQSPEGWLCHHAMMGGTLLLLVLLHEHVFICHVRNKYLVPHHFLSVRFLVCSHVPG